MSIFIFIGLIMLAAYLLKKRKNVVSSLSNNKHKVTTTIHYVNEHEYGHKIVGQIGDDLIEIYSDTIDESGGDVSWILVIFRGLTYSYGYEIDKWVYSRKGITPGPPPEDENIKKIIRENRHKFSTTITWPNGCIRTIYRHRGKKRYSIKAAREMNSESREFWAYLNYSNNAITVSFGCGSVLLNFSEDNFFFSERTKHLEACLKTWLEAEYFIYKNNT